jgi:hypothetical protein
MTEHICEQCTGGGKTGPDCDRYTYSKYDSQSDYNWKVTTLPTDASPVRDISLRSCRVFTLPTTR